MLVSQVNVSSLPFGTPGCSSESGVSFLYWSSGDGPLESAAKPIVEKESRNRATTHLMEVTPIERFDDE